MIAPHSTSPALCSLTHTYAWSHVTHSDNHNPIRLPQLQVVAELILARYTGAAMKTTDVDLHPTPSRWVRSNTVSARNLGSAAGSTAVFTLPLWLLYSTRSKRSSYCTWRYLLKRGSPNDSGECCSFLHSYRRLQYNRNVSSLDPRHSTSHIRFCRAARLYSRRRLRWKDVTNLSRQVSRILV